MRGNVADRTHFNKTVMAIVFPVRSSERYGRKGWRRPCDRGTDSGPGATGTSERRDFAKLPGC